MVPIINYFNEYHAKHPARSPRRAKFSMAQAGKFIGTKAPFGYIPIRKICIHLLVDEEAAER
jgi:hypothetical protein